MIRGIGALGLILVSLGIATAAAAEDGGNGGLPPAGVRLSFESYADAAPGTAELRRRLDQPVSLRCDRVPLDQFVAALKLRTGWNVHLDRVALEADGIELDTPISIDVQRLPLRSALRLALHGSGLTWTVYQGVLWITTATEAGSMMTTRVHEVTDLVTAYDQEGIDWLIDMITTTVAPDAWEEVGGPGSLAGFGSERRMALVVRQTWPIHEEVEELLASLRRLTARGVPTTARPPAARRSPRHYVAAPAWSVPRVYP